jgi:hypothetical protein
MNKENILNEVYLKVNHIEKPVYLKNQQDELILKAISLTAENINDEWKEKDKDKLKLIKDFRDNGKFFNKEQAIKVCNKIIQLLEDYELKALLNSGAGDKK